MNDWRPAGERPAIRADWHRVAEDLSGPGFSIAPAAFPEGVAKNLAAPKEVTWRVLVDEGVARQHGYHAYVPFEAASDAISHLGRSVVDCLAAAAGHLPPPPLFNEVTWTRYPPGSGHITRHRDPSVYVGVIAILTLAGAATFRVSGEGGISAECQASPGHLVLLRGTNWPRKESPRPTHEVDPPVDSERTILTLRANARGPGSGYTL